jgi:uncharacterized membrane protein YhhN
MAKFPIAAASFLAAVSASVILARCGFRKIRYLIKPFLMPGLILFYLSNVHEPNCRIIIALLCAFLGDVLLIPKNKKGFFIGGLFSFFACHIFYIIAFLESTNYLKSVPSWFHVFIAPFAAAGVYALKLFLPYIEDVKWQVVLYMWAILLMSYTSLTRMFTATGTEFWFPFIGSLIFMASDFLLVWNKFKSSIRNSALLIIGTYILAQLLIVFGFLPF